ncbi:MAG: TonB-dependent receptor [Caulobacteraceae bacterium]|nr:TonB-dependent receptor [Caulobacteraceae bacterium]
MGPIMTGRVRNAARLGVCAAALLACSAPLSPALAQSAPSPAGEADAQDKARAETHTVDEIVVTATRRETLLQDTPLSITALGARQLDAMGADGFAGFSRTVPGLVLNQGDPGRGSFSIRGVSTGLGIGDNQAPVALYVDELPTDDSRGARSIADLSLFDVKRVEILRGPQGTLFGSGALGGAIRVLTNGPDLNRLEGRVLGDYWLTEGGAASGTVKGMVNAPLIADRLAVRAVGYYRDVGGYVDNLGTGRSNVNGDTSYGGRISAKLAVTDRLTATATAIFQKGDADESAALDTQVDGRWVRDNHQPNFLKTQLQTYNLKADYDLGWASLMSSTTVSRKSTNLQQGSDMGFSGLPVQIGGPDHGDGFAQELRLSSQGAGRFSWVVGAFYFERKRTAFTRLNVPGAADLLGLDSDLLQATEIHLRDTEAALYGEGSYQITPRLQATVGLRWFRDASTYSDVQSGPLAGGDNIATGPLKSDESKVTPKFVLSYKPGRDVMLYVSAAQGYRIGGTNIPNAIDPAVPHSYRPDSLWNYELGAKTAWLDGRLTLNGALYYIDWSDIQIERTGLNNIGYQDNGGAAHSVGAELEAVFRPTQGLTLSSAISLSQARSDETVPGTNILKGDHLPGARDFTLSNSIEYQRPLRDGLALFVRADHQYQSRAYADFSNAAATVLPSYALVNLRIGVTRGPWKATLFSDNLFNDQRVMVTSTDGSQRYRLKPRTVGVSLEAAF